MSKDLNSDLYKRFGLELRKSDIEEGFCKFVSNIMWDAFYPLHNPLHYKEEFQEELYKVRKAVIKEMSRQLFLDYADYSNHSIGSGLDGVSKLQVDAFVRKSHSFEKFLIAVQVTLNIFWNKKILKDEELKMLVSELKGYFKDYPLLNLSIKSYKTKAPQILAFTSKQFHKEMEDTLGLLDVSKYAEVLESFEDGLKIYVKAKTRSEYKDVVEDMHCSVDEMVKKILGNNGKSFKSVYQKEDYKKLGLNGYQKEMYRNLKEYIDSIKHGSTKSITKEDLEMIISVTGSLLRLLALKNK